MSEEKKKGFWTLTIPLDREPNGNTASFELKEIDESTFMAARALIDAKKDFDAVRLMVKALHVGGDSPELLSANFVAISSAAATILTMVKPLEGTLKKN